MPVSGEGPMRRWHPQFPEFGEPRDVPLPDEVSDSAAEWQSAPASSHVHSFRFVDARNREGEGRFTRKFGDFGRRGFNEGRSVLYVRFKGKTGGVESEYAYRFEDADAGLSALKQLAGADHPGRVVRDVLIAGRVPYEKLAG